MIAMSALGQKQTLCDAVAMSALPPKADMCGATRDVRFVPIADIGKVGLAKKKDRGVAEYRRQSNRIRLL